MINYLSIFLAAALANNLILIQLFGVSSLFYSTNRLTQAIEFSLFNFVVLVLSLLINLLIFRYILVPLQLEALRLLAFVTTSALLTTLFLQLVTRHFPFTIRQQGLLLFLSGGNSAVLGASLLSSSHMLSFSEHIAYSLGAALGYSLLIIGFSALRIRLEYADVPAPFQGSAIQLISAGIIAMSLLGFAGIA